METIVLAFSMFSALPMPKADWDEKNMRCIIAAFPLVGAALGIIEIFWLFLAHRLSFPAILTAAVTTALPVMFTGGIHLDGYMDVSDALSSYADAQKRREILKDPHTGAFAVIHAAVSLLLYLGFASALPFKAGQMLLFGSSFFVSRCLSGLSVMILPLSSDTGLAHTFRTGADRNRCVHLLGWELFASACIMLIGGGVLAGGKGFAEAALMLLCAAGEWLHFRKTASETFGGLSGDLNGWFLVKAELWMLAALVLPELIF